MMSQRTESDPIRAVHLTGSIDPAQGGPAYTVPRLCEALRAAGVETELLTLKDRRGGAITVARREFDVWGSHRLGHAPRMWQHLSKSAAAGLIDITHSHNLWQMPQIYPDWLVRSGIPHVVSPRGTLTAYSMASGSRIKACYWPLVQRPALQRVAVFHATGDTEVEDIRRLGFRQPVALVPIGLDLPEWVAPPPKDSRTILFLGRLHPEKGPVDLIEAWAEIQHRRPDWRLRIIGPDPIGYRRELEERLAVGRIERVEFAPPVYGTDKFDALRQGSIFVLPSPTENFGLVVAEAMAVGLPVIANRGSPWSALKASGAGWWIPHGVGPLADALLEATGLPYSRRCAMGEIGRSMVSRELDWSPIGRRMAEVYAWILRGGEPPECLVKD